MIDVNRLDSGQGGSTPLPFELLAAIDLRGGRVVRLRKGDFERETVYDTDPMATTGRLASAGARWLHVVDLDGARGGSQPQAALVERLIASVGNRADVQVAGGLRTDAAVGSMFAAGAARVVVGTAALRDPAFAGRLVERFGPERIVAALDVRDGLALGEGWRTGTPGMPAFEAIGRLADVGVTTFTATAIERDGLLAGPNLELLRGLVEIGRGQIIASGGVATLDDLRAVRTLGCRGAIVGRAIYEGVFDLAQAIRAVSD